MQQIGQGIYAETGYQGGNVGFVVTGEGVILIDTPLSPLEARQWRDEIARVTDQEVIYIINTDYHPECVVGNHFFGAPVIAHESSWKKMKSYGDSFRQNLVDAFTSEPKAAAELKRLRVITPQITLTDRMELHKGSKMLRLIHVGGHTPASIIVHIPGDSVLFAGDVVVNGMHPLMKEADSKEWLDAMTYIRRPWVKAEVIVPGEGELCDKEVTKKLSHYIRRLRARIRGLYATGRTRAQAVASVAEMVDYFPVAAEEVGKAKQRFRANAERIYEEMRASETELTE
ncbi:MAG: MBL fold metallo-hydrolase [Anaerolineales bacterium]|nr:MBL fold metallo-hydrolase [Anaerolineales bacterium]